MQRTKGCLAFVLVCFVVLAWMPGASADSEMPEGLSLGTSSVGSTFYVIAVGMANLISKNTPMGTTAEAVGGSDANMRAIKMGKVHLAMANSFSSSNAYQGTRQFKEDGRIPIRLIAIGQPSLRQLVARDASEVRSVPDLKGKRVVAIRRALAEIELVADALLKAYNMDKEDVRYVATAKTKEAIDALITKTADAAIIPGGIPASTLMRLFNRIDAWVVDIPDDKMEIVLEELGPAFHKETIPAGTYKGQDEPASAPSLSAGLVVQEDLSEEAVYEIAKALFGHQEDLKMAHKAGRHWNMDNTLQNFHIPFHPGVIRYFKEQGVWSAENQKKQDRLLGG